MFRKLRLETKDDEITFINGEDHMEHDYRHRNSKRIVSLVCNAHRWITRGLKKLHLPCRIAGGMAWATLLLVAISMFAIVILILFVWLTFRVSNNYKRNEKNYSEENTRDAFTIHDPRNWWDKVTSLNYNYGESRTSYESWGDTNYHDHWIGCNCYDCYHYKHGDDHD